MSSVRLIRLCCFVIAISCLAMPAWAYKRESRVPLTGCRGYFAATGSARYIVIRNETKETDREELLVEIHNVPMSPGTVLVVSVEDEAVGKITLDARQSGRFSLTSEFRKVIPPIHAGTTVTLKTVAGRLVMW